MNNDAQKSIDRLHLKPHPEGGHYRETYRALEVVPQDGMLDAYQGRRAYSTAIYFLLADEEFSAFHCLRQDEVWHFYDGAPLILHVIDPVGCYRSVRLGRDVDQGEVLQAVIPGGWYFAAAVPQPASFALVGCTVAPAFQFDDFYMPSGAELVSRFPRHEEIIKRFTRS
jgi:uncharacterized protein